MEKKGSFQKAKLEYIEAYDYFSCELCGRRVECKGCHKEPVKGDKHIFCNLNGLHYHERCLP